MASKTPVILIEFMDSLKINNPTRTGITMDILLDTVVMAIPIFWVPNATRLKVIIKSTPIMSAWIIYAELITSVNEKLLELLMLSAVKAKKPAVK